MKTFNEFMEQKIAENVIGGSPIQSGVRKIMLGLESGELGEGYTSFSILAQKFNLDQNELNNLMKMKIIIRDEGGWRIDNRKLQLFASQLPVVSNQ